MPTLRFSYKCSKFECQSKPVFSTKLLDDFVGVDGPIAVRNYDSYHEFSIPNSLLAFGMDFTWHSWQNLLEVFTVRWPAGQFRFVRGHTPLTDGKSFWSPFHPDFLDHYTPFTLPDLQFQRPPSHPDFYYFFSPKFNIQSNYRKYIQSHPGDTLL